MFVWIVVSFSTEETLAFLSEEGAKEFLNSRGLGRWLWDIQKVQVMGG